MDVIRTASIRDCQFFRDSDITTPIKWYRAPAGALTFPATHRFGHLSWYSEPWKATGVGEVYASADRYFKGDTPAGVKGQTYFGLLSDFQQGATYDSSLDVPRTDFGLALACPSCLGDQIAMESGGCDAVLAEDAAAIELETA